MQKGTATTSRVNGEGCDEGVVCRMEGACFYGVTYKKIQKKHLLVFFSKTLEGASKTLLEVMT